MNLDEEKLKQAFKENPETAKQFFFGFRVWVMIWKSN